MDLHQLPTVGATPGLAGIRSRFLDLVSPQEQELLAEIWERVAPGSVAAGGPSCGS